jgi:hypothetical protein
VQSNANYKKAVSILHERYGQREEIVQTYMKVLLYVPIPVNSFSSLRHFMTRAHGSFTLCLSDVRKFLLKRLIITEAGNELQTQTIYSSTDELQTPMNYPPTAAFVTY